MADDPKHVPIWAQNIDWLTPEEIESLRADAKATSEYAKKAFAHLRPKEEK